MPRPAKIDRPRRVEAQVPESILARVDLELFSDLEGRVPHGKRSELITMLLKQWLVSERGVQI